MNIDIPNIGIIEITMIGIIVGLVLLIFCAYSFFDSSFTFKDIEYDTFVSFIVLVIGVIVLELGMCVIKIDDIYTNFVLSKRKTSKDGYKTKCPQCNNPINIKKSKETCPICEAIITPNDILVHELSVSPFDKLLSIFKQIFLSKK